LDNEEKDWFDEELDDSERIKKDIKKDNEQSQKHTLNNDREKNSHGSPAATTADAGKRQEKKQGHHRQNNSSDTISLNIREVTQLTVAWLKKNSKWLIPLICILIAISLSTFFRMYTVYLPAADTWAENQLYNNYKMQIASSIERQFPNLPERNKQAMIEREFQNLLEKEKETIEQQKKEVSSMLRSRFQDDNGDTYLVAIDPYLWYGEARNYLNYGHLGDTIIDGKSVYSLRDGRFGKETTKQLHPIIGAYWHRIFRLFDWDASLMKSFFFLPVVIIGLSIIPLFLITRKIAGNVGGLFAGVLLATNTALLQRTPAGFSDTDSYTIFFPLLIGWLFLEAWEAQEHKRRIILSAISGTFIGVYAMAWSGWWFTFVLPILTVLIVLSVRWVVHKGKHVKWRTEGIFLLSFFLTSALSTIILKTPKTFYRVVVRPFKFIRLKELKGISLWPNVLTTVAEFNTVNLKDIIYHMGGKFLFAIALVGVVCAFLKKNKRNEYTFIYGIFLTLWLLATAYAFTKGTRFNILMVPAVAIAFGAGVGTLYKWGERMSTKLHVNRWLMGVVMLVIFSLLFITPMKEADQISKSQIPAMNDAWYESLTKIKNDSSDNAIITSWWDFGHWFTAIGERKVTFDGGDQGERIYWVGRFFLAETEEEAIGILRMLNCGQEQAPHIIEEYLDPIIINQKAMNNTVESINILDDIIILTRDDAEEYLTERGFSEQQRRNILKATHCNDLLPQYVITSEDMVGKASVWGHFGTWDFKRALVHQTVRRMGKSEALQYITNELNMSMEEAKEIYLEILTTTGDDWVASWPGYGGVQGCRTIDEEHIECSVSTRDGNLPFIINVNEHTAAFTPNENITVHPQSLVYLTENDVKEKEFTGNTISLSLVLKPIGDEYMIIRTTPKQAKSLFTRLFYLKGHGLHCFKLFHEQQQVTGERIQVWKVDWSCQQQNSIFSG
jgi:dolichyl-diphosphooligosaccharide--protein glycosyltransferase